MGGRYRVEVDDPGQRLEVAYHGRPAAPLKTRLGCLSVIVIVLLILIPIAWFLSERQWLSFLAVIGFYSAIAALFVGLVLFPSHKVLTFSLDRSRGSLDFTEGLPGWPPKRSESVPFAAIVRLHVRIESSALGGDPMDLPMRLQLFRTDEQKPVLDRLIMIRDLDRDREVRDFLARIATIAGLSHQRLLARDPKRMIAEVCRDGGPDAERVPAVTEPSRYSGNRVDPAVAPVEEVVAAFDPSSPLPGSIAAVVWNPPQEILFRRHGWYRTAALAGLALVGAVGMMVLRFSPESMPWASGWQQPLGRAVYAVLPGGITYHNSLEEVTAFLPSLLIPVSVLLAILALQWGRALRYRCRFDLVRGELSVRMLWTEVRIRRSAIAKVVFRRVARTGASGAQGRPGKTFYHDHLEAELTDGTVQPLMRPPEHVVLPPCRGSLSPALSPGGRAGSGHRGSPPVAGFPRVGPDKKRPGIARPDGDHWRVGSTVGATDEHLAVEGLHAHRDGAAADPHAQFLFHLERHPVATAVAADLGLCRHHLDLEVRVDLIVAGLDGDVTGEIPREGDVHVTVHGGKGPWPCRSPRPATRPGRCRGRSRPPRCHEGPGR